MLEKEAEGSTFLGGDTFVSALCTTENLTKRAATLMSIVHHAVRVEGEGGGNDRGI
jgi:hypothetical protein